MLDLGLVSVKDISGPVAILLRRDGIFLGAYIDDDQKGEKLVLDIFPSSSIGPTSWPRNYPYSERLLRKVSGLNATTTANLKGEGVFVGGTDEDEELADDDFGDFNRDVSRPVISSPGFNSNNPAPKPVISSPGFSYNSNGHNYSNGYYSYRKPLADELATMKAGLKNLVDKHEKATNIRLDDE